MKPQTLHERRTALLTKRDEASREVDTLSDDMAAGIDGARAAAINRADDLRAINLEIQAVDRLIEAERQRDEDDRPRREAEALAEKKKRRAAAVADAHAKFGKVDAIARDLKAAISEAQVAVETAIASGVDEHARHQMLLQYTFEPMLVAAGFSALRKS